MFRRKPGNPLAAMKWKLPSRKPRPPLRTKEDVLREANDLMLALRR